MVTNVILLTLAHPQPLFFYAYLQLFLEPYSSLLHSLQFLIALKFSVIPAFRYKNAPQLRLYQNWGANMVGH